jgi:hypothetical protein
MLHKLQLPPWLTDLKTAQASAISTNQELASKSAALYELAVREQATQDKLRVLGKEKKLQEQIQESTQKMLSKRDYSSSAVISSVVAHAVVLLKSYLPDLYLELLRKDYPFEEDEEKERDGLIDSVYETAQYFVSQYDFSVVNDQGDEGTLWWGHQYFDYNHSFQWDTWPYHTIMSTTIKSSGKLVLMLLHL